jgi:hypothetical protein
MKSSTLIKKRKSNFPHTVYKEIQSGAVAKSYMRKGFLINEKLRKYLTIYEEAVSHTYMILQLLNSEFPYKGEKFSFLFYQCTFFFLFSYSS